MTEKNFRSHQNRTQHVHDNFVDSVVKIIDAQGPGLDCDANGNLIAGSDFSLLSSDNSFFGCGAGSEASGGRNVAVGFSALNKNAGDENIAVGYNSLNDNAAGFGNVAVGTSSMESTVNGLFNVALGNSTLRSNLSGNSNVAVGQQALSANLGSQNVAVGSNSLSDNTTGLGNTAFGYLSLLRNTSGTGNVGVGNSALLSNTTGSNNTALGLRALNVTNGGSGNIGIGLNAGNLITTGNNNIFVGNNSDVTTATFNSTTVIGNDALADVDGGLFFRTGLPSAAGASVEYIPGTGQMGPAASTLRKKKNVENLAFDFSRVYDLRPVSFVWNEEAPGLEGQSDFGLIAEEVEEVFPGLVPKDGEGKPFSVKYDKLSVLLLGELRRLELRVKELESKD